MSKVNPIDKRKVPKKEREKLKQISFEWVFSPVNMLRHVLKDGLCIKVTFMHNGCWVNYYEKWSLR